MQPPPRKAKHSSAHVKTLHADQISKLQHKHQHEIELLEDIRLFTKQRSSIEKEYAQSLCKLAQQFLSKGKFPGTPNIAAEDGKEFKTVTEVWRTVLEETDRVGKIRLQAADTYLQQISDPVKPIKTNKTTVAKKVFEQVKVLQKDLDQSVQELNKSQKSYNEEEHITHDAVAKATEAEAKVKNKSTGIFTSLAKLQQSSAKLMSRKDACEMKSTAARNEYLLNLASTNVHLDRYYISDLPELIKMLDGEMYDKVRDFFITLSKMEVDCCGLTQERFMKILTDSTMVSRQFDHQCFLHNNLVFTDKVQYQYEPQENDPITKLCQEYSAGPQLIEEAKKWSLKLARENKTIKRLQQKIDLAMNRDVNGGSKEGEASSPTSPHETEARIDDLKIANRKAETSKRKAEARIKTLREGGINVDDYMARAQAQVDAEAEAGPGEDEVSQRSVSARSESMGAVSASSQGGPGAGDGEKAGGGGGRGSEAVSATTAGKARSRSQSQTEAAPAPEDSTYVNYQEDDFDETFAATEGATHPDGSIGYASLGHNMPMKAVAIYDFQSEKPDELHVKENEAVEVIGDGDGDGWVQARNSSGQVGFVPQNYLQYTDSPTTAAVEDQNEMNVDHDTNGEFDSTVTSAGYNSASASVASVSAPTSAGYDSAPPSAGYDTTGSAGDKSNYSTTDYEVQETVRPHDETVRPHDGLTVGDGSMWARALYDFEATSEEELSFQEGQLIRVIQKDEQGVDDGWWKGEINGRVGVFPSLVVEEVTQDQVTAQDMASPNRPGPPAFTPPEPGPPPPQLAVTQPTPSDEGAPNLDPTTNDSETGVSKDAPTTDLVTETPVEAPNDPAPDSDLPPPPPDLLVADGDQNDDAASTAVNYNSDSIDTCSTVNGDGYADGKSDTRADEGDEGDTRVREAQVDGDVSEGDGGEHVIVVAEVYSDPSGDLENKDDSNDAEVIELSDEPNGESLL